MSKSHAPALASVVRAILNHLPTKFRRARLNGPRQMLLLLLATIHSGIDRIGIRAAKLEILTRLDRAVGWSAEHVPSTSAISRALRKLKPHLLEEVITMGLTQVATAFGPKRLVHDRRLVAIDGVRVNVQRTTVLARWLGIPKQADDRKAHQPQALVVVARCVITGVVLAQEIVRNTGSERACARKLILRLAGMGPMLVLMDRGFPARDLIGVLVEHKIDFVVRMCGGKRMWRELQGSMKGKAKDIRVAMRLRGSDGRWFSANLRAILTDKPSRGRPRCNRTPQRMILLTNLTSQYWSTGRSIAAYHRRWDIETSFREDKRLLGATRSRATTRDGVINELLALQIYRILMALIAAQVVAETGMPGWNDPRTRRLTTTQLIVTAWWLVEVALTCAHGGAGKIDLMVQEMVRDAAKKRPGRAEPRVCRGVEGAWKNKTERGHG